MSERPRSFTHTIKIELESDEESALAPPVLMDVAASPETAARSPRSRRPIEFVSIEPECQLIVEETSLSKSFVEDISRETKTAFGSILQKHLTEKSAGPTGSKCTICDKHFKRRNDLSRHVLVHTGYRAHNCVVCNKCFKLKKQLNEHMAIHTKHRNYKCDVCKKNFTQKSHLNVHKLIHTGQRAFQCDICSRDFTQKSTLNRHMVVHSGKSAHPCHICKNTYTLRNSLRRHLIKHH